MVLTERHVGQLAFDLPPVGCLSCGDARWVEPFPEFAFEPEPCPECCEVEWLIWLRNPYGLPRADRCERCKGPASEFGCRACRIAQVDAHFHRPRATGQLGLVRL